MIIRTARVGSGASDELDITLKTANESIKRGVVAPGSPWAPSGKILWPTHGMLDLARACLRRAETMPTGEARTWIESEAMHLARDVDGWYRGAYLDVLRSRWSCDREAWSSLLGRETVTLACWCRRAEPGPGQIHYCHRHHLATLLRDQFGATYLGEEEREYQSEMKWGSVLSLRVAITGCRPPRRSDDTPAGRALYATLLDRMRQRLAALRDEHGAEAHRVTIIHGGAGGIDEEAETEAARLGMRSEKVLPHFDAFGRAAPIRRNLYVVTAPVALAFPAPWSSGTFDAIKKATLGGCAVENLGADLC